IPGASDGRTQTYTVEFYPWQRFRVDQLDQALQTSGLEELPVVVDEMLTDVEGRTGSIYDTGPLVAGLSESDQLQLFSSRRGTRRSPPEPRELPLRNR